MIGGEASHGATDPTEKYDKPRRRKTKPDKYEYKRDVDAKRPDKASRGSKRKRFKGGHTLSEEFQASNVDVTRVSLKPVNNLGIFSRSKTSVPLAGHDLPDLTFTKMDFLSGPAEVSKRDITKTRMHQSDRRHKRDPTHEHRRLQSGPERSSASEHVLPVWPAAEHGHVSDGRVSTGFGRFQNESVRERDTPHRRIL